MDIQISIVTIKMAMMNHYFVLWLLVTAARLTEFSPDRCQSGDDINQYLRYHRTIAHAQQLIAHRQYQLALNEYRQVVDTYPFVFSREYKVATQLAIQTGQRQLAFAYLKKAIAAGWTLNDMKKNALMRTLVVDPEWRTVERQYDSLRASYQNGGNHAIRTHVEKLFKKDQCKALLALFRFSAKAQDRYAERSFAPHSEQQVAQLNKIIDTYGYPGERLIHNGYWAAVILSHHNSISKRYALSDTLYRLMRPKLIRAIEAGQMSPYEFAMIDDWYEAVKSERKETHFGYLSQSLTRQEKLQVNQARAAIGLSSIDTIELLTALQQETGFDAYLPTNLSKKINIVD
jgi:hypothetical protein